MTRQPSWEAIAIRLGNRMENHAWCDDHGTDPEEDCPFCEDRSAYLAFVAKVRSVKK